MTRQGETAELGARRFPKHSEVFNKRLVCNSCAARTQGNLFCRAVHDGQPA
jgi:hypothetical protein